MDAQGRTVPRETFSLIALGSLPPRALHRSMLQPLLTPYRDRWTRLGIACTGGDCANVANPPGKAQLAAACLNPVWDTVGTAP